ncbi:glycoside hydrolase domain-containing protein [Chitinimonas arctica]|uniref:glycoside hydrolase domain-containing protein n=1 Tax=Chitinimonas arctica TaxID=2594795 RepID=UPI001CC3C00A|nr:glycoside hydrolase domain-containing protein [Chitinimonas arctica]
MAYFAGFDTSTFPGVQKMAWLKANTNLVWCGYYLAPAPSHPGTSWMGQRAALQAAGWGIAPVYVGQQLSSQPGSHTVTAAQGTIDGNQAAALLQTDGFGPGRWVYLDLENGAPYQAPRRTT